MSPTVKSKAKAKEGLADQHNGMQAQREGEAVSEHASERGDRRASSVSYIFQTKLGLLSRYLEDHTTMSQDKIAVTPGPFESLSNNGAGPSRVAVPELARDSNVQGRRGKQPLRKSLRNPTTANYDEHPVTYNVRPKDSGGANLTTIHAHPQTLGAKKQKRLGIFNKGKAVVSNGTTDTAMTVGIGSYISDTNVPPPIDKRDDICNWIAFSEREFLASANINRIRLDGAENAARNNSSPDAHPQLHQALADDEEDADVGSGIRRESEVIGRRMSVSSDNVESNFSQHDRQLPIHIGPTSEGSACHNAFRQRCRSYGHVPNIQDTAPSAGQNHAHFSDSPFGSHTWLSQQARSVHPTPPASADREYVMFGEHVGDCETSPVANDTTNIRFLHQTDFCSSLLLGSISDCLNENAELQPTPLSSSNSMDLDLSLLFERQDAYATNPSSSECNIRDYSLDALSGFNSSFFASQDLPYNRCVGDITVDDLRGSRNEVNTRSSLLYPPLLSHHHQHQQNYRLPNEASVQSFDTLPEYAPQLEMPPPYLSMHSMSSLAAGNDNINEIRRFNQSRAYIPISAYPNNLLQRNLLPYGDFAMTSTPPYTGIPVTNSRSSLIDFRYYPRRMN
ncbi:hypothetical protein LPJ66_006568 [Kickxella alabastrina]|uniref:Uncharacterized protein n=1 Tax=Kickxella alabastrina TaxID=61397 RepID=A0ACC1IHF1_9FUNG|nr:hypothetical protein LPJ66_006568 [Kickxella alabastrina]